MKSYLARLDKLPPCICLLLARRGRKPIPIAEIAKASGASPAKLRRIIRMRSWANVGVEDADRIREACGIYPSNERRHVAYLKRITGSGGEHLKRLRPKTAAFLLAVLSGSPSGSS